MDELTLKQALGSTVRTTLWEQTKGNLQAMMATFVGQQVQYAHLGTAIDKFVRHVEDNGLHE